LPRLLPRRFCVRLFAASTTVATTVLSYSVFVAWLLKVMDLQTLMGFGMRLIGPQRLLGIALSSALPSRLPRVQGS
jgi:hypothetical protein